MKNLKSKILLAALLFFVSSCKQKVDEYPGYCADSKDAKGNKIGIFKWVDKYDVYHEHISPGGCSED